MYLCYQISKYCSIGCTQEQGFTFKSVVNVNTFFVKPLQLSGFDLTFLFPTDAFIACL